MLSSMIAMSAATTHLLNPNLLPDPSTVGERGSTLTLCDVRYQRNSQVVTTYHWGNFSARPHQRKAFRRSAYKYCLSKCNGNSAANDPLCRSILGAMRSQKSNQVHPPRLCHGYRSRCCTQVRRSSATAWRATASIKQKSERACGQQGPPANLALFR